MTAPLKIGIYLGGLVALFFASFLIAQLFAPAGPGGSWSDPVKPPMEHSQGAPASAASGSDS